MGTLWLGNHPPIPELSLSQRSVITCQADNYLAYIINFLPLLVSQLYCITVFISLLFFCTFLHVT